MITALITFICILIAHALFVGAFYMAKHHVSLQQRVNILEDSYKEATEYIEKQEEHITTLQQELNFIRRTEEEQTKRERPGRAWNPNEFGTAERR